MSWKLLVCLVTNFWNSYQQSDDSDLISTGDLVTMEEFQQATCFLESLRCSKSSSRGEGEVDVVLLCSYHLNAMPIDTMHLYPA
jgi:hypothetical protein